MFAWFLYEMVAHFTMRTYGVNQVFRFVEGGYIERVVKSDFFLGKGLLYIISAQHVLSYHLIYVPWVFEWGKVKTNSIKD